MHSCFFSTFIENTSAMLFLCTSTHIHRRLVIRRKVYEEFSFREEINTSGGGNAKAPRMGAPSRSFSFGQNNRLAPPPSGLAPPKSGKNWIKLDVRVIWGVMIWTKQDVLVQILLFSELLCQMYLSN